MTKPYCPRARPFAVLPRPRNGGSDPAPSLPETPGRAPGPAAGRWDMSDGHDRGCPTRGALDLVPHGRGRRLPADPASGGWRALPACSRRKRKPSSPRSRSTPAHGIAVLVAGRRGHPERPSWPVWDEPCLTARATRTSGRGPRPGLAATRLAHPAVADAIASETPTWFAKSRDGKLAAPTVPSARS